MMSYFTTILTKCLPVLLLLTERQLIQGLQCLECPEVYNPEDCSLSGTCGRDEMCFTRSFINFRDRKAFRMGCENKDVCEFYNRTALLIGKRDVNGGLCRQCCNLDNCNYQLCPEHTTQPPSTTTVITKPASPSSTLLLSTLTTTIGIPSLSYTNAAITTTTDKGTTSITTMSNTDETTDKGTTVQATLSNNMRDCQSYLDIGVKMSGVYLINPGGGPAFNVYCDMTTDGGGWTVLQRRVNGSVSFQRTWDMYKHGFGSVEAEFWLGNDFLHMLTSQPDRHYTVRFDLTTVNGSHYYATYSNFTVAGEGDGYMVNFTSYHGDAGDNFSDHRGMKFSTSSHDNDAGTQNCAALYRGGWWYHNCYEVNINGEYGMKGDAGLVWYDLTNWTGSLNATSMAIRPQS